MANMEQLRRDLNQACRCVSDLEADLEVDLDTESECDERQRVFHRNSDLNVQVHRLKDENGRLQNQIGDLHREVFTIRSKQLELIMNNSAWDAGVHNDHSLLAKQLQQELSHARESLSNARCDRKRLKSEKCELLNQMKDVYRTLETKERELRDFIRLYEQKMRETEQNVDRLTEENSRKELEIRELVQQNDNAQVRIGQLMAEIDKGEVDRKKLASRLEELPHRFAPLSEPDSFPTDFVSLPVSPIDNLPSSSDQSIRIELRPKSTRTSSRDGATRLSKLLGFGGGVRHRLKVDSTPTLPFETNKRGKLLEARSMSVGDWKQVHVQAWLELELGLPVVMCVTGIADVKSGKVLLSMNDNDIVKTFNISHPLLKRKIRLAIEEYRLPEQCKHPNLKEITWQFVTSQFLYSCGLEQYTESFRTNLVDGRVLQQLTKKQLEKHLGVCSQFHQNSILMGVELLRRFDFNVKTSVIEMLENRRSTVVDHNVRSDLLLWTNGHFSRWLDSIDLSEYSGKLNNSGVHGAVVVLDQRFSAVTFAQALDIGANRHMVRRHLGAEFGPIVFDARTRLAELNVNKSQTDDESCSLTGDSLMLRSMSAKTIVENVEHCRRRNGIRSSFSRIFGLHSNKDCHSSVSLSESRSMMESMVAKELAAGQLREQDTFSSTTSDLGSSVERNDAKQPPLSFVSNSIVPPVVSIISPNNNINNNDHSLTLSADSAVVMIDESSNNVRFRPKNKLQEIVRPRSMFSDRPAKIDDCRISRAAKVASSSFSDGEYLWLHEDNGAKFDANSGPIVLIDEDNETVFRHERPSLHETDL